MTAPVPTPIEQLLTVADVMKLLQVKRTWVFERAASGDLPGVRLGNKWRFEPEALREYVKKNRTTAPRAQVLPITGARR